MLVFSPSVQLSHPVPLLVAWEVSLNEFQWTLFSETEWISMDFSLFSGFSLGWTFSGEEKGERE